MIRQLYERYILPHLVECACSGDDNDSERAHWVAQARGVVVEFGFGSGLNARYYDAAHVTRVLAVDPNLPYYAEAAERAAAAPVPIELLPQSAETLPFAAASADTVLVTWSLCTIPQPALALAEARRVLRPGGRLIFVEHGLAADARAQRWQRRINPIWKRFAGGCNLTRDVPALIAAAGFSFERLEQGLIGPSGLFDYQYAGVAVVGEGE